MMHQREDYNKRVQMDEYKPEAKAEEKLCQK